MLSIGVGGILLGSAIGNSVGGIVALLGVASLIVSVVWLAEVLRHSTPKPMNPAPDPPHNSRGTRPELSEAEILREICATLTAIKVDQGATRTYAGCLLAIAVFLVAIGLLTVILNTAP
jgi:hypothetical protein